MKNKKEFTVEKMFMDIIGTYPNGYKEDLTKKTHLASFRREFKEFTPDQLEKAYLLFKREWDGKSRPMAKDILKHHHTIKHAKFHTSLAINYWINEKANENMRVNYALRDELSIANRNGWRIYGLIGEAIRVSLIQEYFVVNGLKTNNFGNRKIDITTKEGRILLSNSYDPNVYNFRIGPEYIVGDWLMHRVNNKAIINEGRTHDFLRGAVARTKKMMPTTKI